MTNYHLNYIIVLLNEMYKRLGAVNLRKVFIEVILF
jgi:hypothetical protein